MAPKPRYPGPHGVVVSNYWCITARNQQHLLREKIDFSCIIGNLVSNWTSINIMRQSACLVFIPITVNNFASLFNSTPVGRASDSMMAPT